MSTLEFDLVRLTAQSSGPNPKEPGGGMPAYTKAEIMACLAEVPHLSFHCLLAKYCGDELSLREVVRRAKMMNLQEWFTNAKYATTPIEAGQLNKLAELSVLGWLSPSNPLSNAAKGSYIGANHETFRRKFQDQYHWIIDELNYHERLGGLVYRERKYGKREKAA